MPHNVDGKNWYNILIVWTHSGQIPGHKGQLELFSTLQLPAIFKLIDTEMFSRRQTVLCFLSGFMHTRHMEWAYVLIDYDKIIIESTCNLHSNLLRTWIGSI